MATQTELYREILTNLGMDCDNLPDNTITTLLSAIAQNCGGGSAGGGVATAIINMNGLNCDMTFEEATQILERGELLNVVLVGGNEGMYVRQTVVELEYNATYDTPCIRMMTYNMGEQAYMYWTASEILPYDPNGAI